MAAVTCADPVEEDGTEGAEVKPVNSEPFIGQSEEEKTPEVTQASDQQPSDGKTKPTSEKIWGSFLKNSGKLGKVMGGKKKKDASNAEANVESVGQDKPSAHSPVTEEEETLPTSDPKEQSTILEESELEKQKSNEKEPENPEVEEAAQEQKPSSSNKDVKPKHGERSSVRDFIRKPVTRIFSHKSTDKKDFAAEAQTERKTRSRSLDRMEEAGLDSSATEPADNSQAAGEPQKLTPHEAKNVKRWSSFKRLMPQKSVKRSTEDCKDLEGVDTAGSQVDSGMLEAGTKVDRAAHKKWKLKRSWTFQGLKRDPSVTGIHKSKGTDKGDQSTCDTDQQNVVSCEDGQLPGEEETQDRTHTDQEEEKVSSAQRTRAGDHHANEIWTSFKKRVTPKSKKSADHVATTEEEHADDGEHTEDGKLSKQAQKKTHFNTAVSLKNFLLRKGKSTSVDMGESAEQGDGITEGAGDAPKDNNETDCKSPIPEDNKHNDDSANETNLTDIPLENKENNEMEDNEHTNGEEKHSSSEPEVGSSMEGATRTEVCQENGNSSTGGDCSHAGVECTQQSAEGKEEITEETVTHAVIPQEDVICEIKKEDACSQEGPKQDKNGCSSKPKDEEDLCVEHCSGKKHCSGTPVAESGECDADLECCLQQPGEHTVQHNAVPHESCASEPIKHGPPQNGGSHPVSGEAHTELNDQEEDQKRMFCEAAASIVQMVVSAAVDQIAKDTEFVDSEFKGSYSNTKDSYADLNVNFSH